jgi:hypothetical protein
LEDLKNACAIREDCVAFNTDGCLKKDVASQFLWRPMTDRKAQKCAALYMKEGEQV